MALHFQTQAHPGHPYEDVDLEASKVFGVKLRLSYSAPATLSWSMFYPHNEKPIPYLRFIRFWDDADPGADEDNPHFEGFVEVVTPADDGHTVNYEAHDPTVRTSNEFTVMNREWIDGVASGSDPYQPVEHPAAYPRIVFNCTIDNDDDWALQRTKGVESGSFPMFDNQHTVGEIIKTILDDQNKPLFYHNAAPDPVDGPPYDLDELELLDFIPQEKVIFESECVRSAVERLTQVWYPAYRLLWTPGSRQWRFKDISASDAVSIVLNDPTADYPVLSFDIDRSLQGRHTAVKIYGPEVLTANIASTQFVLSGSTSTSSGGIGQTGLVPWDAGEVLETVGADLQIAYSAFKINDPNRSLMARILPEVTFVRMGEFWWQGIKSPTLQMRWTGTNINASGTAVAGPLVAEGEWITISGVYFDFQNGVAYTGRPIYVYNSEGIDGDEGTYHYFPPDDVRIVYAYLDAPISVRYPETGFEGTAFDEANLQNELKLYDDMLAVGYNWIGQPITTSVRLERFEKLAERIHAERKDVVYIGGVNLAGIDFEYKQLDRRVNIEAVDVDGVPLATGWEDINAIVTDVEYDWENDTTVLQFSGDHQALLGIDTEAMKAKLKIRAAEYRQWYTWGLLWGKTSFTLVDLPTINGVMHNWWGGWFDQWGGEQ